MASPATVLLPDSRARTLWDFFLFLVTLTMAVLGPIELVYKLRGKVFLVYSGIFLTCVFLIDMILNFRTAYYYRGEIVDDPKQITRHYLRTWFIVDFVSLFPFDLITGHILVGLSPYLVDIAPALRLARLVRLLHLKELINRWRHADFLNPSMMRLGILLLWMLMVAHWAACGWIVLGNVKPEYNAAENYLRAFYWVITTFATIGYGDITPANIPQIAYTICVEIVGV
ncbi:MAG TPA: ion transporter, partial [Turneriella sp.]|nr:ion transporter [Turneriella sp.]